VPLLHGAEPFQLARLDTPPVAEETARWRQFLRNRQIASESGLDHSDVQTVTEQLRRGLVAKAPEVELAGEVESDKVWVVAGHKGQPAAVAKRAGSGAGASWQARRAAARWRRSRQSSA